MSQNPLGFFASVFGTRAAPKGGTQGGGQLDPQGALWETARHTRDYTASYLQTVGMASNQAGVTTSAGLATTYVGLCLSNPVNSGKNLVPLSIAGLINVATGAPLAVGLITGFLAGGITAHTTALTVGTTFPGSGAAAGLVGLADSACTLVGSPIWSKWVLEIANAGVGGFNIDGGLGQLILPPGAYLAIGTSVAGPASGFLGSITWAEEAP